MSKQFSDQAEGLRRLLASRSSHVVAIAAMAPKEGATTAAMCLGAALVQQGQDVLLLDEHDSVCDRWALPPAGRLEEVIAGRRGIRDAAVQADCGVHVLAAGTAASKVAGLWPDGVTLVDAALDREGHLSAIAQAADELVLVLQPNVASLTAAYAGIKRLHYAHGIKQFRLLINAVSSPAQGQQIADNMARAASRYLAVSLPPAGFVVSDRHLQDAARLRRTVVEAFPASPAAVDFRRIAQQMGQWSRSRISASAPAAANAFAPLPADPARGASTAAA